MQAYVIEDNKQLILEGQLHVALQTIGKEATSLKSREVQQRLHEHLLHHYESVQLMLADLEKLFRALSSHSLSALFCRMCQQDCDL